MSRRPARRALFLAAAAMLLGACAEALGLTDYTDAVDKLCVCDQQLPDCRTTLEEKLGAASDMEVRGWLTLYHDLACDQAECGPETDECFYSAPGVCHAMDAECSRSAECCGFDFNKPEEGAGCCAVGDGTCCASCLTCAAALGKSPPDRNGVCKPQRTALDQVLACRDANCKIACVMPGKLCNDCVNASCKALVDACNANKDP